MCIQSLELTLLFILILCMSNDANSIIQNFARRCPHGLFIVCEGYMPVFLELFYFLGGGRVSKNNFPQDRSSQISLELIRNRTSLTLAYFINYLPKIFSHPYPFRSSKYTQKVFILHCYFGIVIYYLFPFLKKLSIFYNCRYA